MPKPRGLKASKKAAAPAVPDVPSTESVSKPDVTNAEDALSLYDLLELRLNALDLLYAPNSNEDQVEEAQGFLRGILHGCEALSRLAGQALDLKSKDGETEPLWSSEENSHGWTEVSSDEKREEARAAGLELGIAHSLAPTVVLFLQAFALSELAKALPEGPSAASSVSLAGNKKRRKIDLKEPRSPADWYDHALARLEKARLSLEAFSGDREAGSAAYLLVKLAVHLLALRTAVDRAILACVDKTKEEDRLAAFGLQLDSFPPTKLVSLVKESALSNTTEETDERIINGLGDLELLLVDSLSSYLDFLDDFNAEVDSTKAITTVRDVRKALDGPIPRLPNLQSKDTANGSAAAATSSADAQDSPSSYTFRMSVLKDDLLAKEFTLLEDQIEQKYRPDSGEDESDSEGDEENDVAPLPDAEDVRAAREFGLKGTSIRFSSEQSPSLVHFLTRLGGPIASEDLKSSVARLLTHKSVSKETKLGQLRKASGRSTEPKIFFFFWILRTLLN
jgi:hypothetical protein